MIVLLCIGILSATGIRFYAGLVRETAWTSRRESMVAFLAACRQRAVDRGIPVTLEVAGRKVAISGSPNVTLSLDGFDSDTRRNLAGMRFTASGVTDQGGRTLSTFPIASDRPDNRNERFDVRLDHP